MNGLKKSNVELDRSVLADLAITQPQAFSTLVSTAKAALAKYLLLSEKVIHRIVMVLWLFFYNKFKALIQINGNNSDFSSQATVDNFLVGLITIHEFFTRIIFKEKKKWCGRGDLNSHA